MCHWLSLESSPEQTLELEPSDEQAGRPAGHGTLPPVRQKITGLAAKNSFQMLKILK